MEQYSTKIRVVYLPTKEIRNYSGYFSLKEVYLILKKYEKDKDFVVYDVDYHYDMLFGHDDSVR